MITLSLDSDELVRQYERGLMRGVKSAGGIITAKPSSGEFELAIAMTRMAIKRDCQASANQAIYIEGYGLGLKLARLEKS